MRFLCPRRLLILLLLLCHVPASARVLLKPNGQGSIPLRAKSLQAKVRINGQFAHTTTEMVFQNEISRRIEADFIYTVPDGTTVTYFAYWFGEEKVVARIVEKERAAQIYQHITSRQRDPALVEMIDENTFRARIFPIEPNADLKVEMHSVQVLNSDAQGAVYTFPLKPDEAGKGTLEKIDLDVEIERDARSTQIHNNYNLPLQSKNGVETLNLSQRNWRASQDLRVRIARPVRALHASLYSAPAGGTDGFFALALTPSQNVKSPRIKIEGITTYEVLPRRLPNLKKHETVTVVGRYQGSGAARVLLTGYEPNGGGQAAETVTFGSARESENLASKLWARQMLEDLQRNSQNREHVVEMSKRFNLPGKFTSWLAVPESEMKTYKTELAQAEMHKYGQQLANLFADGKENTAQARELRRRFDEKARFLNEKPQDALSGYLSDTLNSTAYELAEEKRGSRPDQARLRRLQSRFDRMAKASGGASNEYVQDARKIILHSDLDATLNELAQVVQRGEGNSTRGRQLRAKAKQLSGWGGVNLQGQQRDIFQNEMMEIAQAWAEEKAKTKPSQTKLNSFSVRLQRLSEGAGQSPEEVRKEAALNRLNSDLHNLSQSLAQEIIAGREQDAKARELRAKAKQIGERLDVETQKTLNEMVRQEISSHVQPIGQKYVEEKHEFKPDETKLNQWKSELERIAAANNTTIEELLKAPEQDWARSATYDLARELVQMRTQEKPDETHIKFLEEKLDLAVTLRRQNAAEYERNQADRLTAEYYLSNAEYNRWSSTVRQLNRQLAAEKSVAANDKENFSKLEGEREKILSGLTETGRKNLSELGTEPGAVLYGVRHLLLAEMRKENPRPERVTQLKQKLVELEKHDWYLSEEASRYTTARKITDPELYGQLRAERLEVRVAREKIEQQLPKAAPTAAKPLQEQRAQLAKREHQLTARMGDPLIAVEAPPDAVQVIAVLPGGSIKKLVFNLESKRWEARFDIPTYATEGEYSITLIVVFPDGARQTMVMRYRVDVTSPDGTGQAQIVGDESQGQRVLRLEFDGSDDTARIFALLPWGEKIEMSPSNQRKHGFFAIAPLPSEYSVDGEEAPPPVVTFILTDRAHNRTSITMDLSQ